MTLKVKYSVVIIIDRKKSLGLAVIRLTVNYYNYNNKITII